jgi:heavy metal translocating P-type ATPase
MKFPQVKDDTGVFCCSGCHAVFAILSSKNALDGFQTHPIFKQALEAGIISNPKLLEELKKNQVAYPKEEREKLYLEIGGLWCPFCSEIIQWMLLKQKGVIHVVVDWSTDLASIEFSPRFISKEKVLDVIQSLGYKPCLLNEQGQKKGELLLWIRFLVAAFLSLNIMMLAYPLYATYFDATAQKESIVLAWTSAIASLPVITFCAWPIWRRLWNATRAGIIGMELLVFFGVFASFILSFWELYNGKTDVYFDSMTAIVAFILLGKIVEGKAKMSARDALVVLSRSVPKRARKKFLDGSLAYVPAKEMEVGQLCVVNTGEKIPLDGIIVEGHGATDESFMTGESIPKVKKRGDSLISGAIVQSGSFVFEVTATVELSALKQILDSVENQLGKKSPYTRAADQIIPFFIPFTLIVAFATLMFGQGTVAAISVLLISCPCALGIAAPLAESKLIYALASFGAIVRNRAALSFLGSHTVAVFDKTGTLTEGKFKVKGGLDALSEEILKKIKGLASRSNHPICYALKEAINLSPHTFECVIEHPGLGVVAEDFYLLGSATLLKQRGIDVPKAESCNTLTFYFDGTVHPIELGDTIRAEARETMIKLGPCQKILLSGDGEEVVKKTAISCGMNRYFWGMTPLKKRERIEALKQEGEIVMMVGDGINDAPALATAHVGVSVVNAQDVTIQSSDLLLTEDRLTVLPNCCNIAKNGKKIVRQNLFWAFFYNVLGIPMAALGYLSPIYSALAMVVSSLIVIINARRVK